MTLSNATSATAIEFGATIEYVRETEPLGTAGCFNQVRDRLSEPFVVIYGDILMDVDLGAFAKFATSKGGAGTLFAHPETTTRSTAISWKRTRRV